MSAIDNISLAFRIFGDDLEPQEVTSMLGIQPTTSYLKGGIRKGKRRDYAWKTGGWLLERDFKGVDVDSAIKTILSELPNDLSCWRRIDERFTMDLYFGLWMSTTNDGFHLDPDTIALLADRRLTVDFDIYIPTMEELQSLNS
jgi:Domain of unknown function (DUF4279)